LPRQTATTHGNAGTWLTLFGRPTIVRDGHVIPIVDPTVAALAAYLVLHDGEPVSLPILAGLSHAATSTTILAETREALHRLDDLLGHTCLTASGDGIGIDTGAIAIDVVAFERETAAAALDHYKGRLLDGIDETAFQPPFAAWLERQRRRLHERALTIGLSTMKDALELSDTAAALEVGGHLLDLEPALESAHRMIMQAWFDIGQRDRAIEQYKLCSTALAADGNRRPHLATTALRDRYLDAAPATVQPSPAGGTVSVDTNPAPLIETPAARLKIRNFVHHPTTLLTTCVVVAFSVLGLQFMDSFTRLSPSQSRPETAAAAATAPTTLSVIAVAPFATASDNQTPAYHGHAIGQELVRRFGSISNLFVIDITAGVDDPSAITARYLLSGEYSQNETATLSSTLVDRQTGRVVWRHKIAAPLDKLSATLSRTVRAFAADHKLQSGLRIDAPAPAITAGDMAAYMKARADAAAGDYDQARMRLDRQLSDTPGFPAMHLFRAELAWRALTAVADDHALTLAPLAASTERATFDDALTVAMAAGLPAAYRLEALQLLADGSLDAAINAAGKAVVARPNDAAAHATLAELLIYGGDIAAALDHIDRSGRLAPPALGRIAWLIGLARLGGPSPAEAAPDLARAARHQAARAPLAEFLSQALDGRPLAPVSTRSNVDRVLSRLPFRDPMVSSRITQQLIENGSVLAGD